MPATNATANGSAFDYRLLSSVIYAKWPFSLGMRWQHLPELDTAPGAAPPADASWTACARTSASSDPSTASRAFPHGERNGP